MKYLLTVSFCLFALMDFAAAKDSKTPYTYTGVKISKRSYDKLFRRFKSRLFVLPDGKVIFPVNPSGGAKQISFSKKQFDGGEISGKILRVIDKNTFILKTKEMVATKNYGSCRITKKDGTVVMMPAAKYFTSAISCPDTSSYFAGETFTGNVIQGGAYVDKSTGRRFRRFDVLKPITEPEFKKYLDDGNELYYYRKKLTGYTACGKCGGRGKLPNPKNSNRKKGRMAYPDLTCQDCKYGRKPVYEYTRIPVKIKRKARKVAAR